MTRVAILLTLEALVFSACTLEGEGPSRSLSALPTQPELSGGVEIQTGALGFGAVEGGCGFLETAAGKRFEVIYPKGWRLDLATGRLRGPEGQDVGPGAVVSIRGSITTDIASICQVGPMFRAIEVVSVGD